MTTLHDSISKQIQVKRRRRKTVFAARSQRFAGKEGIMNDIDFAALEVERDRLLARARTILMAAPVKGDEATGDTPEMGVTPVVRHDGGMFIYPSRLSAHVRAMLAVGRAAFLVIEDESEAQNIWARKRIKFNAQINEIDRKSNVFSDVCDVFAARHGPTMGLIRDFTDFHLLRLRPTDGLMVLGFAQAYRLEGPDLAVTEHLRQG